MRLRIGPDDFDLARRPLIVARVATDVGADEDLLRAAKGLVGQGADLVEIALGDLSEPMVSLLATARIPTVARLTDATAPPHGATDRLIDQDIGRGIHALSVTGTTSAGDVSARTGSTLFTTVPEQARPGDGLVVAHDGLDALSGIPDGVIGIVDLTPIVDRAGTAAAVTVALEKGAHGFVTTVPSPVRRAAHVIRAVEHAR